MYGAPAEITLRITIDDARSTAANVAINLDLQWAKKRSTRMAESIWLTVMPSMKAGDWQLHKLGAWYLFVVVIVVLLVVELIVIVMLICMLMFIDFSY